MKTSEWSVYDVRRGDLLEIQTARGEWIRAVALSRVEPGDKFPIVWVDAHSGKRLPWPIESIRPRSTVGAQP